MQQAYDLRVREEALADELAVIEPIKIRAA
jgi:hypothetical protein